MTRTMRAWIDTASLEDLLMRRRFAEDGNPFFIGRAGQYYAARLAALHEADPIAWARISNTMGLTIEEGRR